MKHAVYSGSRNLYPEMAAAAKSLAANSDVDRIYLLIEDPEFPSDLPSYVEAIDVSGQGWFPDGGPNMNSEFTYLALIRAALCHLFPDIDRILSLDVDAFCVGDVSDVWDIPLDGFYLAASPEPVCCGKGLMYCNTGVALYNLDMLRDGKADEVIEVLNRQHFPNIEQDVFSYLCTGRIRYMPPEYNATAYTERTASPRVVHYAGIKHAEWKNREIVRKWRDAEWPVRSS